MSSHATHFEEASEGALCGQAEPYRTSPYWPHVTCKRCLAAKQTRGYFELIHRRLKDAKR